MKEQEIFSYTRTCLGITNEQRTVLTSMLKPNGNTKKKIYLLIQLGDILGHFTDSDDMDTKQYDSCTLLLQLLLIAVVSAE